MCQRGILTVACTFYVFGPDVEHKIIADQGQWYFYFTSSVFHKQDDKDPIEVKCTPCVFKVVNV